MCGLGNDGLRVAQVSTKLGGLGMHQDALEAVGDSGGGRVRREGFAANKPYWFNTRSIEAGGRRV
jgi:hypothetical protein